MNTQLVSKCRILIVMIAAIVLSGCVTNSVYKSGSALSIPLASKILVFPADVIVAESKALSATEPLADESKEVAVVLNNAIMAFMFDRGVEYVPYGASVTKDEHISLVRQAEVIVDAAQSKSSSSAKFYALSKDSLSSVSQFDADYVLLSDYSLTKPSSGAIAVSLLVGVANTETYEGYNLALFDLRDGQLVWSHVQPVRAQRLHEFSLEEANDATLKQIVSKMMMEFPL